MPMVGIFLPFSKISRRIVYVRTKDWSDYYISTNEFRFCKVSGVQAEYLNMSDGERTGLL